MVNLLALDQASKTTGWSVFKEGKLFKYGKFTFNDQDMGVRLCKIRNKIIELINEYDIEQITYEDIQLQDANVRTFKALAEVFGVVNQLTTEYKIPAKAVLSTVWKSKLGIKGQSRAAQKQAAQAYVTNKYNIKATQDESDAICIGDYTVLIETQPAFPTLAAKK